jgi:hypothetical protein
MHSTGSKVLPGKTPGMSASQWPRLAPFDHPLACYSFMYTHQPYKRTTNWILSPKTLSLHAPSACAVLVTPEDQNVKVIAAPKQQGMQ